jgi:hypothetical protein
MWTLEKKLPARGVKFYFITKQDIPEKERASWQETVSRSSPLSKWFERVQFEYSDRPSLITDWQGWNLIKIFCPDARISMKPSEAKSSYKEIFELFSDWFTKLCRDKRIECKPYDFRILFRLRPPESPGEFVPIPSLNDISRKVVSPPSILPNPPTTPETMSGLAQKTLSGQAFEEVLKYAEKENLKVYAGYGVRTEEHANTYEFDILLPDQSKEVESMRSLHGELYHELILQCQEKAPLDFNNIVKVLLTKLIQNGVIDNKKVEDIYNNPGDYFEATQWCTRFVLKFDLKKWSPDSELGRALDVAKKQLQKELTGTKYYLYGAISYKLTDQDLTKIEEIIEEIIYFKNAKRDDLFTNISILLVDGTYEKIIEIARKTDEILNSHKIIDINTLPGTATDIEDAKKRWNSAVSDSVKDGRRATSFLFLREISGVPLQVFMSARESLYEELNKIAAETRIGATITSDNQQSIRYGCYVAGPKA